MTLTNLPKFIRNMTYPVCSLRHLVVVKPIGPGVRVSFIPSLFAVKSITSCHSLIHSSTDNAICKWCLTARLQEWFVFYSSDKRKEVSCPFLPSHLSFVILQVDGKLTLSENIADNGALNIAFRVSLQMLLFPWKCWKRCIIRSCFKDFTQRDDAGRKWNLGGNPDTVQAACATISCKRPPPINDRQSKKPKFS